MPASSQSKKSVVALSDTAVTVKLEQPHDPGRETSVSF